MKTKEDGLTYNESSTGYFRVRLNGKTVGEIRPRQNGFRYYPNGTASPGEWFATLWACKQSLEQD